MDLIKQYESETGKSAWAVKDYVFTEDYTKWVRYYVKNSDNTACKIVREFSKKINEKKYSEDEKRNKKADYRTGGSEKITL